jgi:glucose-6-phosphate isomerase
MGFQTFKVPEGVGGRYSVLTPVGLLPLAVAGVNVAELLKGAAAAAEDCTRASLWSNPAYAFAVLMHAADEKKKRSILVMMPTRTPWPRGRLVRPNWAESLGKRLSTPGREFFAGKTPVKAVGARTSTPSFSLYGKAPRQGHRLPGDQSSVDIGYRTCSRISRTSPTWADTPGRTPARTSRRPRPGLWPEPDGRT